MTAPGFRDYFSREAARYAAHRPTYPPELYTYLVGAAPGHALAWDAGTGNGQVAGDLVPFFDRVIATDASADQIAHAPPHPRIDFRVARAEEGGPDPGSCDLVTVGQAIHWFDQAAFFEAAARALRPGGLLAVWGYGGPRVTAVVDDVLEAFQRERVGPYWPPERRLVDDGLRGLTLPFAERGDVPELWLEASWDVDRFLGYLSTWSATRCYRDQVGDDPVMEREASFRDAWGVGVRPVRWPIFLRAGHRPPSPA